MKKFLLTIANILIFSSLAFADIPSDARWNVQADGTSNNGSCYKHSGSGVDYSLQATAQLTLTDLATSGAGSTTLTSATGGFTAQMVDNCIAIASGTNFQAGFYLITGHTDTNTVTLDRTPTSGGAGSGGTGRVGGALNNAATAVPVAGNKVYIKAGTYTLAAAQSWAEHGTSSGGPIVYDGYHTTQGDNPTGDNRPLFDANSAATNCISMSGNLNIMKNIRCANSTADGILHGNGIVINVKVSNTGDEGIDGVGPVINSEIMTTTGNGAESGASGFWIGNYVHDVSGGGLISVGNSGKTKAFGNIVDTCAGHGIELHGDVNAVSDNFAIANNVYNCTGASSDGIAYVDTDGDVFQFIIINNIAESNGRNGISSGETGRLGYIDFNSTNANGTAGIAGTRYYDGGNNIAGSALFNNAAGGDFTVQSGSPVIGTGFQISNTSGIAQDYKWNIGVDQDDVSAASGIGVGALEGGME